MSNSTVIRYKKYAGISSNISSFTTHYKPVVNAFNSVSSAIGYYNIDVEWSGLFSKTELYWNTTNVFDTITDSSLSFTTETSTSVVDLLPETTYYFKLVTYGITGFVGDSSSVSISTASLPIITNISAVAVDTSAISVSWSGIYTSVNIVWSDTETFDVVNTTADVTDTPYIITGLNSNTAYYIKILPVGLDSYMGDYSSTVFAKTDYNPYISTNNYTGIDETDVLIEWDGLFNIVDIQYDISDTFLESPVTISGITTSYYTLTELTSLTPYYVRLIPYNDTVNGDYSNTITASTVSVDPSATVYIATYSSGADEASITVSWDENYYSMDLRINPTGIFNNDNDAVALNLTGVSSYTFTGLTANTKYYIRSSPYISDGVSSPNKYISAFTLPTITNISAISATDTAIGVEWEGIYGTVNITYDTTEIFDESSLSVVGLTASSEIIIGLISNTTYYFKATPYSAAGVEGTGSAVINKTTKPAIVSVSSEVIDNSSINVYWEGTGDTVDIVWNTTGVFDVSDSSLNGIDIANTPKLITGLNDSSVYYFKVKPYSSLGGYGDYSAITETTTLYTPEISDISGTVIDDSSVIVAWDGSFDIVDLIWDLDGTFTSLAGSLTDISVNEYSVTGLTATTPYYFKIIPKTATYSGTPSAVITKTTLYTPSVSTLTTSQVKPTSVAVNLTGTAYSAVDINWGLTDGFTTSVGSATDISNVSSYTISGLSPSTTYYFVITPKEKRRYGAGFYNGSNISSSASTTYISTINGITLGNIDNSAVSVAWTGTYSTVDVLYNKTGIFTASYSSKPGLSGTSTTITGLESNTKYFFTIRPYSNTGYVGTDSDVSNITTYYTPAITKLQGYVYDSSSIVLSWEGVFATAVVSWSISNAVVQKSGQQTGLTVNTTTITGLNNLGDYTFTITPSGYGTTGTSKSVVITKSNYTPVINNVYATASGINTIMVEWVGNYTNVSINYNETGDFTGSYTTISGINQSYYIVNGLSISTKYYFRVVPYYSTMIGTISSVVSVSTKQPERGYKVMKHNKFNYTINTGNYTTIFSGAVSSSSGQYIFTISAHACQPVFSSDYGSTWAPLPIPPVMNNRNNNIAISSSGKYLMYAATMFPVDPIFPLNATYKINTIYFYYSGDYGNTWGEFPYNSMYTTPSSATSYFNKYTKFKINDFGECIIALTLNTGAVGVNYTHYVLYTSDYGKNFKIITANNVGNAAIGLFECDEQMTKMIYLNASGNLYSITAPFSSSTPTLISSNSFASYMDIVMSGDGSTFIISRPSGSNSLIHLYKYSGSVWSLIRTVSVTYTLIHWEDIKINYDASRILLKYNWSQTSNAIYASYNNLLTYSHYYTPSANVLNSSYLSASKNDNLFMISGRFETGQPGVVTTDSFATIKPFYSMAYTNSGDGRSIEWETRMIARSSDYKHIYVSMLVSRDYNDADRSTIFYSNDYGTTFNDIKSRFAAIAPDSQYFCCVPACSSTGEIVYISVQLRTTNKTSIIKSIDGGTTWSLIKTNLNPYQLFTDCDSTGSFIIVNSNYSLNGGITWNTFSGIPLIPFDGSRTKILSPTSFVILDPNYGISLVTYNFTTLSFNHRYLNTFNLVNISGSGTVFYACSSDVKYVYAIVKAANNSRPIIIYKSSNYGVSYSTLLTVTDSTYYYGFYIHPRIWCSDDGSTVLYTYSFGYNHNKITYIGLSKDYGVTFKTDLAVGLYNDVSKPSYFDVSPDGKNYMFWRNNLVVNSPNIGASVSLYISSYMSDTTSTSTTINWDPVYSKVDINRNKTNLFDINDTTISGVSSTTSQTITGLSPNTTYYFRVTPYISDVATTKEYTNITTLATISSASTVTSDISSIGLVWDGSFTSVNIYYNTTGTFTTTDASLSGIATNSRTVSGLTANTLYYFRITPISSSGTNGMVSSIVSKYTTPSVTNKTITATGPTELTVSITGLYSYYTLKWNTTGIFDVSDNTATNITTSSYLVTGLDIETMYYFRATPVGTGGIVGTTSDTFSAKTPYIPVITDISCYTITDSTAMVSWDGSFNNANVYWDLSGTFTPSVGSTLSVSGNSTIITGLTGSTTYYFKISPKYDTFSGTSSLVVNTTTYYNPLLSAVTSTPVSTSQINLAWDGSFTGVLVKYNTTNIFDTSGAVFTTLTFTTETAYSLTGLLPATIYYFRVIPQGTTGFNSTTVYNTNSTTDYLPVLTDVSVVAIDTSSVTVSVLGKYENVNIDYNDSGDYSSSYNTISTITSSTIINGLVKEKYYYFRARPVGLRGLIGGYSTTKAVKTLYLPRIDYVVYLTLSKSSISLDYDGSFTSVSIIYDTSSTFAVAPTTITGITAKTYILSDLQNNTTYYMKTLPYVLTVSGEYSAVASTKTNKAAAADYDLYKVFDVNFNRSNLIGGVAKENVSGALTGNFGLGISTTNKRLYVNYNYAGNLNAGYILKRDVATFTGFLTFSAWINTVGYVPGQANVIFRAELPWSDINAIEYLEFRVNSSGFLEYMENYGGVHGGSKTWVSTGAVKINRWTNVAVVIDVANGIPLFYVDGVYYSTPTINTSQYSRTLYLIGDYIKAIYVGVGGLCYIDNVKIYKTTSAINLAGINAIMSDGNIYSSLLSLPVLHYPFDGDYNDYSSGSAVSNSLIYSADLYNQAFISSNSVCGTGSLSLDRLYNQYISLARFSIDASGLTVYGWANTAQSSDNTTLFQLSNGNTTIYLCCVSNIIKLIVKNSSNAVISTINTGIPTSVLFTGTWFHYAITIEYGGTSGESSVYKIYINGNYYTTATAVYPITGLYNANYIGYNSSTSTYTSLLCDSFGVYTYPLTSAQITALYEVRSTKKDSVNNKLVYYYKFISKDISGNVNLKNYGLPNGYDGSVLTTNAAYSSVSKFNIIGRGSLRCGSGSYINHKNYKPFSNEGMTCAFWIKIDANSSGSGFINPIALFGGNSNSALTVQLSINTTTGYLSYPPYSYVYQNGNIDFASASPTVPTGKTYNFTNWTHLCYVYYQNYAVLYINSVPYKKVFTWAGWDTYPGSKSYIGSTDSSYFNGYMDDIRIYNTSLSQTEITGLYNYDGITEPNTGI